MRIARALYHSPHFCNAFGAKSPNRTEFKFNSGGVKARYKFSYKRSFNLCLALRRSLYVLRVSNNAALSRWVRHSFQQELRAVDSALRMADHCVQDIHLQVQAVKRKLPAFLHTGATSSTDSLQKHNCRKGSLSYNVR